VNKRTQGRNRPDQRVIRIEHHVFHGRTLQLRDGLCGNGFGGDFSEAWTLMVTTETTRRLQHRCRRLLRDGERRRKGRHGCRQRKEERDLHCCFSFGLPQKENGWNPFKQPTKIMEQVALTVNMQTKADRIVLILMAMSL
jgi:hypothetical protein